jgi:hypothetical protein
MHDQTAMLSTAAGRSVGRAVRREPGEALPGRDTDASVSSLSNDHAPSAPLGKPSAVPKARRASAVPADRRRPPTFHRRHARDWRRTSGKFAPRLSAALNKIEIYVVPDLVGGERPLFPATGIRARIRLLSATAASVSVTPSIENSDPATNKGGSRPLR